MICPKPGECKIKCLHIKAHLKTDSCSYHYVKSCSACVPYRLRIGDRVRTLLGDVGEINELTCNNESAKVYDKSGRRIAHCFLSDLEYLPPEVEENQKAFGDREAYKNFYSHNQAFLLKFNPDGTARTIAPTYRWTGKPLTWLDIANKSRANISDLFRILTWFDNQRFILLKKENIVFSDKFINYATKHECFRQFLLEDGYIEQVKPDWLLG